MASRTHPHYPPTVYSTPMNLTENILPFAALLGLFASTVGMVITLKDPTPESPIPAVVSPHVSFPDNYDVEYRIVVLPTGERVLFATSPRGLAVTVLPPEKAVE